jgi:hypothetical protein
MRKELLQQDNIIKNIYSSNIRALKYTKNILMTPNSEKLSDSETGKFFYIPHIATDRDPD